jgi:hypothetical protein
VVLIASGPSAKHSGIEALRGKVYVLAVKQGIEMAPWADAVYGCDHPWWEYRQGLPNFKGLKMAWQGPHTLFAGVVPIRIPDPKSDHLLLGDVGVVGSGRNSGFQALNLAVQFGMRRGLLIGYDATDRSGVHYYGRNNWSMANNPTQDGFAKWQAAFHIAAVELKALGIEVWNAGQYSAIKSFRKLSVLEAAREWGL